MTTGYAGAVSADLVLNNKMGSVIASAGAQLTGLETKMKAVGVSISTSFDGALGKLKAMPAETKYLGAALALGVTAPILAFGKASTKTFSDFDDAMRQVQAVTSATGPQFTALTELAREMGETTSFKASEAADAMNYLGMAGFDANEIISALPSTLSLARAGVLDLGSAADIMSNVMTIFSLNTSEAAHVADVLAKVAHTTNTDVLQLGEAMSYAGPVAATFGLSMEMTAAAMGMLGNAGIQASMAGTTLRGILQELVAPTKASMDIFSKYGLTLTDLDPKVHSLDQVFRTLKESGMSDAEMFQVFGQRAGPGLLSLLNQGIDKLGDYSVSLNDIDGYATQAAATMDAGFGGSIRMMNSAIESLSISMGSRLAVMLEPLVSFATKAAAAFADMNPHLQDVVIIMGLVLAAIGPVILALAALPTIVTGVTGGLALLGGAATTVGSAFFAIGLPIAAVVAALVILDRETGVVSYTWRLLKDLFTITVDGIMKAVRILRDYIVDKIDDIKKSLSSMIPSDFISGVTDAVGKITSQFTKMGGDIHDQAEGIRKDNTGVAESAGTLEQTAVPAYTNTGNAASGMGANVQGAVAPVDALTTELAAGTPTANSFAVAMTGIATASSGAAAAVLSATDRIGPALRTTYEQIGNIQALAGKWNISAPIGITSSGGSGTGEGNVKVVDRGGVYGLTASETATRAANNAVYNNNVKINTINNNGTSTSVSKLKSAGV